MKRLAFVVLAVSAVALASDDYKLTIAALNGSSVVSASDVGGGLQYFLKCPTGTYRYKTCTTSSCTAATTSSELPASGLDFWMPSTHRRVAVYGDGSAGNCYLYQVDPPTLPWPRGF